MILTNVLKRLVSGGPSEPSVGHKGDEAADASSTGPVSGAVASIAPDRPAVLNVGGASKSIPIPSHYASWQHLLLDISPGPDVDVVQDARELARLQASQFDAVYCSHNLEHYYKHDAKRVLSGFLHVLKPSGFVELRVPDMRAVLKAMIERKMDIDDVLYVSPAGPISVHDVIYGFGKEIERSGVDFFAHKQGFTAESLRVTLGGAGFAHVHVQENPGYELGAVAFKSEPTPSQRALFGL